MRETLILAEMWTGMPSFYRVRAFRGHRTWLPPPPLQRHTMLRGQQSEHLYQALRELPKLTQGPASATGMLIRLLNGPFTEPGKPTDSEGVGLSTGWEERLHFAILSKKPISSRSVRRESICSEVSATCGSRRGPHSRPISPIVAFRAE